MSGWERIARSAGNMATRRYAGRRPRHPNNRTEYAALDKLAADPRIERIWDEGPNGIWADLAPGYNREGCSSIHGEIENYGRGDPQTAVKGLLEEAKYIEEGEPY